jgi:hypothetical protein
MHRMQLSRVVLGSAIIVRGRGLRGGKYLGGGGRVGIFGKLLVKGEDGKRFITSFNPDSTLFSISAETIGK